MMILAQFVVMSIISVMWCQALRLPNDFPPTEASDILLPHPQMWPAKLTSVSTSQTQTSSAPLTLSTQLSEDSELKHPANEEAKNAVYSFGSNVVDGIMDNMHARQEMRKGLKLIGSYSYSDGYNKHTVYYEADQNGYRIVKNVDEPIGNGPKINPEGKAEVIIDINGNQNKYTVYADNISKYQTTTPVYVKF